jgi:hypothetical protein
MGRGESLIATVIDKLSKSTDVLSSEDLKTVAKRHTVKAWRWKTIRKVTAVGFLTGLPGGCVGFGLAALDLAYLFAAAGRGCYGIGHILERDIDREKDLQLILACWCGTAQAVSIVTAGKVAIKVFGKSVLPLVAGIATQVVAKAAFKGGSKLLTKVVPQIGAKLAGQFAGKAGAMVIPILGGCVSALISYWVASSLMSAAEQYYRNDFVQFNDPGISVADLAGDLLTS